MSKKKVENRNEKAKFNPDRKKGIGEIYPWNPPDSPELISLKIKNKKTK